MMLHACPVDDLIGRMQKTTLLATADVETLRQVARTSRLLCLGGSEVLAAKGTVLPGFCLVLAGSLQWADSTAGLAWVHPGHTAAGTTLPAAVVAGPGGAECLYVSLPAFLDLLETEPAWAVAMVQAMERGDPWP